MSAPVWCVDLAAGFWAAVGDPPPLPRDLRDSVVWLPLDVQPLPGLRVSSVCHWLAGRGVTVRLDEPDRPLRACLFADVGVGVAFLDADDDPAEQRFSLAHELAHYLRDYRRPRQLVEKRLGRAALEVLDGRRKPTIEERLHAILRNAPVGPFAHLLRRDESGRPLGPVEWEAESAADRLAFELLAPAAAVGMVGDAYAVLRRLVAEFGLPPGPAARYAAILRPDPVSPAGPVARVLIV